MTPFLVPFYERSAGPWEIWVRDWREPNPSPILDFTAILNFEKALGSRLPMLPFFAVKKKKKKNFRSGNKGSTARTTMKQKIQNITRTSWAHITLETGVMYQSMVSLTGWGGGGEHRAYDGILLLVKFITLHPIKA